MARSRQQDSGPGQFDEKRGRWDIPEEFNFARDVVEVLASDSNRQALTSVDGDGVIKRATFVDVAREAARWSNVLRGRGGRPGDRVMVIVDETAVWLTVMLGVLKAGMIAVPCSRRLRAAELAFRARDARADLVIADRRARPGVERMQALLDRRLDELSTDDVSQDFRGQPTDAPTAGTRATDSAFILYTAGPAARGARGVLFDHGSTAAVRNQARALLDARGGDLVFDAAPTGSAASVWNTLLGAWSCGAELLAHDVPFEAAERLLILERLSVTVLCQTADEYRALVESDGFAFADLGRLRRAVSTGGRLDDNVVDRFRAGCGLTIYEAYGRTEAPLLALSTDADRAPPGTKCAIPGHELAVIGADGDVLAFGEIGDIAVRGRPPTLFTGYWNATKDGGSRRGEWFVTGDRGRQDVDGYLSVVGEQRGESPLLADENPLLTKAALDAPDASRRPPPRRDDEEPDRAASNEHLHVLPDIGPLRATQPPPSRDPPTPSYPLQLEPEDADRVEATMTPTNQPISSFRAEQSGGVRLLTALRRHWVLIVALVVVAVGATFVAVRSAEKRYETSADILVTPLAPDDSTYRGFSLIRATYGESAPVVTAARILGSAAISRPALASLGALADRGSVEVRPLGQVSTISIIGKAASADDATALANGFAESALTARNAEFQRELTKQISRLSGRAAAIPASAREGNFQ